MKTRLTTLCATLICLFAFNASMQASTYYASPTGGGNGNSYTTPTTWAQALNALQSGDSLFLLGGVYSFDRKQDIQPSKSGSASQRTFIGAYPGETPIFDFRQEPYGSEVTGSNNNGINVKDNVTYLHIKGLTIRYAGKNGLINYGSYNLFENLNVYGCCDTGIQMKNGGNNTILNCDSHDNFDYKLDKSGNLTACDFGGNADGFADKQFTGAGNHYIGCRAWNNSDDGWDFFQRISTSQTVMENCICYINGPASYHMTNHPRYTVDQTWFNQFANGRWVIDADENNVYVTLNVYPNMGNGNGFKLGGDNTAHNALVHHCLAVGNTVKGFDQNNDAGTIYLYNNTAYYNQPDYGFGKSNGCQLYVRNCISYLSQAENRFIPAVVEDHNSWNLNSTIGANDFLSLDTTLILSPRNADGSLAEHAFMRLTDESRLVEAGVDVGLPYNGSAPDLGCYESDVTKEQVPLPYMPNAIFHWQMINTSEAPTNGTILTAEGGTIHVDSKNADKSFSAEYASYTSDVPNEMKALGSYGLKATGNVEYLTLRLNSGSFLAGDSLFICGYLPWKVSTTLQSSSVIDSIQTGTDKTAYAIGYMVLPADADSLVLTRNRGLGTGIAAIAVCRAGQEPEPTLDIVQNSTWWCFSDEDFMELETIREATAVRQLHMVASNVFPLVLDGSNKTFGGKSFTRRLKMGGNGSEAARHLWFDVKGNCTLDIYVASANSTDDRTMYIATGSFDHVVDIKTAEHATPSDKQTYTYAGDANRIYLYAAVNGGINFYGIQLTYPDTPTGIENPVDTNKAVKMLRNGQLLIMRGEKIYTATGLEIK